ncbi:HHIP-like protein 2 [Saccostrea echinata]|uniref:HHIP-like protein 2 n=1 Tax=Saccostrea echinata TaxID=191078 RepID=UPI002A7FC3CC|nr:HHIP-like protein 2 [Saccostrea echinata]
MRQTIISILMLIFLSRWKLLHAHLCFDGSDAVKRHRPLKFCSEYSGLGCCSTKTDSAIWNEFKNTKTKIPTQYWRTCEQYLKKIFCAKCDPNSGHFYNIFGLDNLGDFPGLCKGYCDQLYSECREIIPYLTNNTLILNEIETSDSFCSFVQSIDQRYCFAGTNFAVNKRSQKKDPTTNPCLCLQPFATGLILPSFVIGVKDDTHRLFIGDAHGEIFIYYLNGKAEKEPYLDISKSVVFKYDLGLLNMAFHPNFNENKKFYVFYGTEHETVNGRQSTVRVSEFKQSSENPNIADLSTERVILELDEPVKYHPGGQIMFDENGFLLVTLGDLSFQPIGSTLNTSEMAGSVLRIDVDVYDADGRPYGIPADNPFVGDPDFLPEIYAYGLRSPWRCGQYDGDPSSGEGKGRIICGDVGWNKWEELDLLKKGANYGWNVYEGPKCRQKNKCDKIANLEQPIHSYHHSQGSAVVGGYFYRGCQIPKLTGKYVYGDFTGWLATLSLKSDQWKSETINFCTDLCTKPLNNQINQKLISFGEDVEGELYVLEGRFPRSKNKDGVVYRLVDPSKSSDSSSCIATNRLKIFLTESTQLQTSTSIQRHSSIRPQRKQMELFSTTKSPPSGKQSLFSSLMENVRGFIRRFFRKFL